MTSLVSFSWKSFPPWEKLLPITTTVFTNWIMVIVLIFLINTTVKTHTFKTSNENCIKTFEILPHKHAFQYTIIIAFNVSEEYSRSAKHLCNCFLFSPLTTFLENSTLGLSH